eukprot:332763-Chlamydomonas_euryale.AAC.8
MPPPRRNLSDATGQGKLTGGIPFEWITLSDEYLAVNNMTGARRAGLINNIQYLVNDKWQPDSVDWQIRVM